MELTMEQAVLTGMELRRVCNTQAFGRVVDVMREQYQQQLFATDVTERQKREDLYLQAQAFEELLITINTFVSLADAEHLETEDLEIFE